MDQKKRADRDEAQTHAADIVGIVGADADQLKVVVSSRIREEFENGRVYYHLHGRAIRLPRESNSLPAREYLAFYNGVFC